MPILAHAVIVVIVRPLLFAVIIMDAIICSLSDFDLGSIPDMAFVAGTVNGIPKENIARQPYLLRRIHKGVQKTNPLRGGARGFATPLSLLTAANYTGPGWSNHFVFGFYFPWARLSGTSLRNPRPGAGLIHPPL